MGKPTKSRWDLDFSPQPLTAILMSLLAAVLMGLSLTAEPNPSSAFTPQALIWVLLLGSAVLVAGMYPIHLHPRIKVSIITVPLYLMAMLLTPWLAGATAGACILALETIKKSKKGSLPSDIATAASRWVIIALAGATVAHLPLSGEIASVVTLLGTAVVMFVGDIFTASFEIGPMCDESPWRVMVSLVREGSIIEGVQYFVAMLGALAASEAAWALVLLSVPIVIIYFAFKNVKEMQDSTRKLLESMADTVDLRDPCTGGHSRRIAELASQTLKEMNISGPEADLIVSAARVHDIGKLGIPDEILKKPGDLTPEEWSVMKSHAERGAELLARYVDFSRGRDFIRYHHEHWDGNGYPRGLKGQDIPLGARVLAVVDAFDAMTSDRPYRNAMTSEQGMLILRSERGHQWDPTIVDAFLRTCTRHLENTGANEMHCDPQVVPTS